MTRKLLKRLKHNGGFSYVMTTVCFIAVLLIIVGIFEVIRINIIVGTIRDKYEDSIIAASTAQFANVYQTTREGYAASYGNSDGTNWLQSNSASEAFIRNYLQTAMNNGEIAQCTVKSVSYTVTPASLAPSSASTSEKFAVEGVLVVEIPYDFAWGNIVPMEFTVNVKSQWRAVF